MLKHLLSNFFLTKYFNISRSIILKENKFSKWSNVCNLKHNFSTINKIPSANQYISPVILPVLILKTSTLLQSTVINQYTFARTVTKFSLRKGKRKAVKAVLTRFKRLDWGAWIRTRAGRHKKLWKKSTALRKRLREHVFVNGQQSWLLDKMVTNFWRRPKYYVDDPYTPYHTRDDFFITRKKPS